MENSKDNQQTIHEINDKINAWYKSESRKTIYEYLGWTKQEYFKFVADGTIPDNTLTEMNE